MSLETTKTSNTTIWRPLSAFSITDNDSSSKHTERIALILVNTQVNEQNVSYLRQLWTRSDIKVCADGASNVLYKWSSTENLFDHYVPNYVIGDLDSMSQEARCCYERIGVKIIEINDQNSTDFTKSLKYTLDVLHSSQSSIYQIYCLGTFSGRFDHALANLHTLSIANDTSKRIYIVSEESITFLLSEGKNVIYLNDAPQVLGKYCGFFPLLGPTIVKTSGFKWNLDNTVCAFDGQTSSSNEFSKENGSVVIETDKPLLFTMTIKPAQCVDYF